MRSGLPVPARTGLVLLAVLLSALPGRAADPELAARIDAALLRMGPYAVSGVRVVSLTRKEVLYERNADLSLNPASNQKLLTSATALQKLGVDYRYTTRVLAAGERHGKDDRELRGDLVLQGGGDPVLETAGLEELADVVKNAGVRKVTGGLVADDTRYDAQRLGNGWNSDDEPYYYSAQISALTVNRNVFTVDVLPGESEGSPVRVTVKPVPEYVTIKNTAKTLAAGKTGRLEIERSRARNEVVVSGGFALDAPPIRNRDVTMEEPALFAAELFRKLLRERGIEVKGTSRLAATPGDAKELGVHTSVPLGQIVALLNKPSDNLVAELLLKELGYRLRSKGDANAGSEVVEGWLKELGIDTGGVRVNDGSGLSRLDLVSARAISELLVFADSAPWKEAFYHSLPVAAVDGTLRRRMAGTAAEKNVHAKTGSLAHVSALSGYVTTAAGERLVFSIVTNNYPGPTSSPNAPKPIEDRIAVALAEMGR